MLTWINGNDLMDEKQLVVAFDIDKFNCSFRLSLLEWLLGFKNRNDINKSFDETNFLSEKGFSVYQIPNLFGNLKSFPNPFLVSELVITLCGFKNDFNLRLSNHFFNV